jgi:hypothetical protein
LVFIRGAIYILVPTRAQKQAMVVAIVQARTEAGPSVPEQVVTFVVATFLSLLSSSAERIITLLFLAPLPRLQLLRLRCLR